LVKVCAALEEAGSGRGGKGSRGARERGSRGGGVIQSHEELEVYKLAFEAAMRVFEIAWIEQ